MPNVFDPSQKSGVNSSSAAAVGGGSQSSVSVGGKAGFNIELDDLSDVNDTGVRPYYTLYRRPDGTYGFRSYGYGTILGYYGTELELTTAHPTGQPGQSYVVGSDLYIWDSTEWLNVGPFVGPQGDQGVPGVENIIVSPSVPPIPVDQSVTWVWLDTSGGA